MRVAENRQETSLAANTAAAEKAEAARNQTEAEKAEAARNQTASADIDEQKIMQGIRLLLEGIGENPQREGLRETPDRKSVV